MTRLGLVDRVRSWFGAGDQAAGESATRWSLGAGRAELALAGAGAAGGLSAKAPACRDVLAIEALAKAAAPARPDTTEALPAPPPPAKTHLDPLDPEWMRALPSLDDIGHELKGHHQTSRAIADAVTQLPNLASSQADLVRETNRILERQSALIESVLDGITSVRSAFRTIDESSRRQATALGQLEASHREVLLEYQAMLLRAHRRVGRLAALAVLVAAAALGGVGYVAYLVLIGQ
ncbi:MAG TPA: hypothetical protein VM431_06590 [Phycisphaerae bacterium]|nr:hypothetical protein [Phycisphaerae bacterium]